jgi:hypothetical protein
MNSISSAAQTPSPKQIFVFIWDAPWLGHLLIVIRWRLFLEHVPCTELLHHNCARFTSREVLWIASRVLREAFCADVATHDLVCVVVEQRAKRSGPVAKFSPCRAGHLDIQNIALAWDQSKPSGSVTHGQCDLSLVRLHVLSASIHYPTYNTKQEYLGTVTRLGDGRSEKWGSIPGKDSIQHLIQWILGTLFQVVKGRSVKPITHLHIVPRSRMRAAIPPLPHMSSGYSA